jgi:hypothetical protein
VLTALNRAADVQSVGEPAAPRENLRWRFPSNSAEAGGLS